MVFGLFDVPKPTGANINSVFGEKSDFLQS